MKKLRSKSRKNVWVLYSVLILILGTCISIEGTSAIKDLQNLDYRLFYAPHSAINITSDSDLVIFPGAGTSNSPYLIDGFNITTDEEYGIYITGTTKYFSIQNCYVEADDTGIYINNVATGTTSIVQNTCKNNYQGIFVDVSSGSTISNNLCDNNQLLGIWVRYSSGSTVTNNTITNSWYGLYLSYSSNYIAEDNTCNNNTVGITLENSNGCTISNNICNYNTIGLDSWQTDDSIISYNYFQENSQYGVYLSTSTADNKIHHNIFIDNYPGGTSQAYNSGPSNVWYDVGSLEGNHWSNWSGIGSYEIDGSANSYDPYPIDLPVLPELGKINALLIPLSILTIIAVIIFRKRRK